MLSRNKFIKKSILSGLAVLGVPSLVKGKTNTTEETSTFDEMMPQIGYNHIPNKEEKTVNTILHRAATRGHANHGWLDARHSFSFANYHNPQRMNFGVLRVLNDDRIAGGRGFSTHPHDNMEIISILLEGALKHQDSMGNGTVIRKGEIQVMSAGRGVRHSEFNANKNKDVKLLQIWLFPNKKNVTPRYDQISIKEIATKNKFYQILSPNKNDQGVWIHQNTWFSLGEFDKKRDLIYKLKDPNNGVYAFVIEGNAKIAGQNLNKRDGFGIWNIDKIKISAESNSKILLMEVPMTI